MAVISINKPLKCVRMEALDEEKSRQKATTITIILLLRKGVANSFRSSGISGNFACFFHFSRWMFQNFVYQAKSQGLFRTQESVPFHSILWKKRKASERQNDQNHEEAILFSSNRWRHFTKMFVALSSVLHINFNQLLLHFDDLLGMDHDICSLTLKNSFL
jgi:hypothetical protein